MSQDSNSNKDVIDLIKNNFKNIVYMPFNLAKKLLSPLNGEDMQNYYSTNLMKFYNEHKKLSKGLGFSTQKNK